MKGRRIQIQKEFGSRRPGHACRLCLPDIFTDSQADLNTVHPGNTGVAPGLEVTFFIENLVIRQAVLGVLRNQFTAVDDARHIVEFARLEAWITQHHMTVVYAGAHHPQGIGR